MTEIKFAIEGEDAIAATEELLAIDGLTGNYTVSAQEEPQKGVDISTVANIFEIIGVTIVIAEKIHQWYQESKKKSSGKKIAKVLIVGRNGRRLLLENATIEQIRQILES